MYTKASNRVVKSPLQNYLSIDHSMDGIARNFGEGLR